MFSDVPSIYQFLASANFACPFFTLGIQGYMTTTYPDFGRGCKRREGDGL
jgi:hypothetical protein